MTCPTRPEDASSTGPRRHSAVIVVVVALVALAAGCAADPGVTSDRGSTPGPDDGTASATGAALSGEVLVSAAASLTDAFAVVEEAFEHANPDVDVVLNLAGSSALREQIREGAPTDVFAAADTTTMDQVVAEDLAATAPEVFATNGMQIAVPADNPGEVTGLDDFADEALLVGLCAEGVPCGDFARAILADAGVDPAIDTDEPDVRALLTKVELGELDAAITYVTDVAASDGAVTGIDIPADVDVVAHYPVAPLARAPNPRAARAFVAFLLDEDGQQVLDRFGFSPP